MWHMSFPEKLEKSGVEPEAFWLRIRRSSTELHPLIQNAVLYPIYILFKFDQSKISIWRIHGAHELSGGQTRGLLIALPLSNIPE
jgi:hypothetical protein